jgi:hypothetical protein
MGKRYKVLVVGCGNIGAQYDVLSEKVQTHVKAFWLHPGFSVSVYDDNRLLAKSVADKYDIEYLDKISSDEIKNFDCVSICTPTNTHYSYLNQGLTLNIPVMVCEKPLSTSFQELSDLLPEYKISRSKVIVNYMRRFQPAYKELKTVIKELLKQEQITNVSISYQRGLINNCSHALDLIEFLTDYSLDFSEFNLNKSIFDEFQDDPTLSAQGFSNGINISLHGLVNVKFSLFEIVISFISHNISISNSGNQITLSSSKMTGKYYANVEVDKVWDNAIHNYMIPVIEKAYDLLEKGGEDNFKNSIELNQKMLNLLIKDV